MANVTAIYCLKAKKDRTNIDQYRTIVNLINRQSRQGGPLRVQGLCEAKKNFRCDNFDCYAPGFSVSKGEFFLLVDGKNYDTTCWRLRRACRTEDEAHTAWVLTGLPDNDDVYAPPLDPKQRQDPMLYENKCFRLLPVHFPPINTFNFYDENFISVYDIREASNCDREDTWGIRKYMKDDFADNPKLLDIFKKITQCDSAHSIREIGDIKQFVDFLIQRHYKNAENMEPHHSLVIAIIDGGTYEWRCGLWCYMRVGKKEVEVHEVDEFSPDGYSMDPEIGRIPQFD